jgi:serine/threonine-protein kinase
VGLVAWLASRNDSPGTGGGSGQTATSRPPSSTPTHTRSSATASATPQVTVNRSDYVGRPFDDASKDLENLGLKVAEHRIDNPGGKPADTVADVDPTGTVVKGSIVTLSVYREPVPTETPSTPTPTSTTSAPVTPSGSPTPPGQTKSGKPSDTGKPSKHAKPPKAAGKPAKHGKGGANH